MNLWKKGKKKKKKNTVSVIVFLWKERPISETEAWAIVEAMMKPQSVIEILKFSYLLVQEPNERPESPRCIRSVNKIYM